MSAPAHDAPAAGSPDLDTQHLLRAAAEVDPSRPLIAGVDPDGPARQAAAP